MGKVMAYVAAAINGSQWRRREEDGKPAGVIK
jgi:hypothetical protein